jgi:hypothetical protein
MLTPAHVSTKIQRRANLPQRRRRLVRIAYFDEAGTASETQEPYLVVAAVAIHGDTEWQPIEHHAHQIIQTLVPEELQARFCFHARELFSDDKKFKGLLSAETRFALLRELLKIIADFKLPVSYAAVRRADIARAVPKTTPKERTEWSNRTAFISCAMGLQGWFNREHQDEVAICVADRNDPLEASLKLDYRAIRREPFPNHPLVMLFNFVDAVHFASREESIGLQLADGAAFAIKRHLMGKEDTEEFYKIIEPHLCVYPDSALIYSDANKE